MKYQKTVLLWLSIFWLLAACASDEEQAIPTATAVAATPTPTTTPVRQTAVPTPSPTPTPIPTSAVVAGWLAYHSDYYNYSISYPPEAIIYTEGVGGFPTEELPENMTSTAYLNQLRETYPDDICVSISLNVGSVHILAPPEAGGKYADICPGLGIGDYDLVETSEIVLVNGQPFTATGFVVHERDAAGTFRSEFFIFSLEDGTRITVAVGPENSPQYESDYDAAYADYLAEKELLLQIVDSYRSTALTEKTPSRLAQPVAAAAKITVGDWSPDGRYFTYWTHTPEDADVFMPGDFYIYDTQQEQSCPFGNYRTGTTSWKRRHLWPPNGEILVFGDEGGSYLCWTLLQPRSHKLLNGSHLWD